MKRLMMRGRWVLSSRMYPLSVHFPPLSLGSFLAGCWPWLELILGLLGCGEVRRRAFMLVCDSECRLATDSLFVTLIRNRHFL